MPVVVIAALIVFISALTASPDAARFCASAPEERYACATTEALTGNDREQMPSTGRCEEIAPTNSPIARRCDEFAQTAPISESTAEPAAVRNGVVLVAIAVVVMLGTIEVLFRCTIYERPSRADCRQTEKKGINSTGA
jgi:hypothetical protein